MGVEEGGVGAGDEGEGAGVSLGSYRGRLEYISNVVKVYILEGKRRYRLKEEGSGRYIR